MGLNRYAYVNGNPVNLTDPSGMIAETPGLWDNCFQNTRECSCYDNTNRNIPIPYGSGTTNITAWEACQSGFIAYPGCSSPSPIPTALPTNTPRPTTVQMPIANAVLTNCEFASGGADGIFNAISGNLCSRDIHPMGVGGSYPVVASFPSEVMIIDTTGDNEGLGNFVVVRVAVSDLGSLQSRLGISSGYLYIGYAHLASVDAAILSGHASVANPFRDQYAIPAGAQIGLSGSTGTTQAHLDITVFHIPPGTPGKPSDRPSFLGSNCPDSAAWACHDNFEGLFDFEGQGKVVDPLAIWPQLAAGTTCDAQRLEQETDCPWSEVLR